MNKPTKKYIIFGESSSFGGNYGNPSSIISLDEQFSTYASEWQNGMDLIDANAGFPTIEDHGAIFAILSRFQKLYAKYLGFWNDQEEYVVGSWVIASDNNFYRSKTGTTAVPNVGNDPVSTPANWDSMASLIGGGSTLPNGSVDGDILVWDSTVSAGAGGYVPLDPRSTNSIVDNINTTANNDTYMTPDKTLRMVDNQSKITYLSFNETLLDLTGVNLPTTNHVIDLTNVNGTDYTNYNKLVIKFKTAKSGPDSTGQIVLRLTNNPNVSISIATTTGNTICYGFFTIDVPTINTLEITTGNLNTTAIATLTASIVGYIG